MAKQVRVNLTIGPDTLAALTALIKAEKEKSGLDISISAYVRMLVHRAVKEAEKEV
ncbi:MAG TPA: hypothetical protein PLE60_12880 [Candidatus Latescibacteria bacterium]|nr:hypothetical protein [Candidatus Latescibacterota bacterium]